MAEAVVSGATSAPPLPSHLDQVTPDWLAAALSERHPGTVVGTVRPGPEVVRFASSVPLELQYAENPAGLPTGMYLKSTLGGAAPLAQVGGPSAREARFYRDVAAQVPMLTPQCFYASTDHDTGHSLLLLEDLSPSVTFGDPQRALDLPQLEHGLAQLAALHATWWGRPELDDFDAYPGDLRPVVLDLLGDEAWSRSLDRPAGSLVPGRLRSPTLVREATKRMWHHDAGFPPTLIHGDPHLGNTYTDAAGRVGFLDWQAMSAGSFLYDVTRYLVGSSSVETRRRHERRLLAGYRRQLVDRGVDAPADAVIWRGYRRNVLHGLRFLCSPPGAYPEPAITAYVARYLAAADDLQTLASLTL